VTKPRSPYSIPPTSVTAVEVGSRSQFQNSPSRVLEPEEIKEQRRRAREEKDREGNAGGLYILCLPPRGLTSAPLVFQM
jgi:hypothetical protein